MQVLLKNRLTWIITLFIIAITLVACGDKSLNEDNIKENAIDMSVIAKDIK